MVGLASIFSFAMNIYLAMPVLFLVLLIQSCWPSESKDCEKHYDFTIPISISPSRDTFHVGDTIWVESTVENILVNTLDGSETDISQLPLKFTASITEYNQNGYVFSSHLFSYVNVVGTFELVDLGGPNFTQVYYEADGSHARTFKVGVVINSKGTGDGTFEFDLGYLRPDYEEYEVLNKKCLDMIKFRFNTNEGRDSSGYYLLPPTYTDVVKMEGFLKFGSFAFRVVP